MENTIFRRAAVAAVLGKGFVESRQHCDVQGKLTQEQFATNKRMQQELAESETMPYYAIVDPDTGKKLRGTALRGYPNEWEAFFLKFLAGDSH